jgi:hypothetical protein
MRASRRSASVFVTAITTTALAIAGPLSHAAGAATSLWICVKKTNGTVRVVADPSLCNANEAPFQIPTGPSASGPTGPTGPQGPAGPAGARHHRAS